MLASRCVVFNETVKASLKLCIRCFSNLCKNYLNTVLGRNLFFIANDCFVKITDLSEILVKKQMKYFDVPLDHAWKVSILQELLKTRLNNLYVEGFDDYILTEIINLFNSAYLCIILHFSFCKTIFSKCLSKFKLNHL